MNKKPYISVKLMGGLGNQLFQIVATLCIAEDYGYEPIFLKTEFVPRVFFKAPTYWDTLFKNLPLKESIPYEQFETVKFHTNNINPNNFPKNKNILLEGYLQNTNYFKHHPQIIEKAISFSEKTKQKANSIYSKITSQKNNDTVSVHIRRGDYLKFSCIIKLFESDYYCRALSQFDNHTFLIFSDEIEWVKYNFHEVMKGQFIKKNWVQKLFSSQKSFHMPQSVFYVDSDELTSLYLMTLCKHHIIANSTYSWWGAYLSNRGGTKISPKKWFNHKVDIKNNLLENFKLI